MAESGPLLPKTLCDGCWWDGGVRNQLGDVQSEVLPTVRVANGMPQSLE